MPAETWKVGQLAQRTGLTVRTLHWYDRIGLLSPSCHTPSGHRLYDADDVARLQRILSLRALGFPLEEVRGLLDRPDFAPLPVVELHLARLREQMEQQRRLCDRLEALAARFRAAEAVSAEEFLSAIEEMTMFEKYYTPEQMEQLKQRAAAVGETRIREVEAEWPRLMAEVQAAMDAGVPPTDPKVQALAQRWMGLVQEFTGGDPGIGASLKALWQNETNIHGIDTGPARKMMEYIQQALPPQQRA
jgi:DNA-binding transcriptional MerR regulator